MDVLRLNDCSCEILQSFYLDQYAVEYVRKSLEPLHILVIDLRSCMCIFYETLKPSMGILFENLNRRTSQFHY